MDSIAYRGDMRYGAAIQDEVWGVKFPDGTFVARSDG